MWDSSTKVMTSFSSISACNVYMYMFPICIDNHRHCIFTVPLGHLGKLFALQKCLEHLTRKNAERMLPLVQLCMMVQVRDQMPRPTLVTFTPLDILATCVKDITCSGIIRNLSMDQRFPTGTPSTKTRWSPRSRMQTRT